MSPEHTPEKSAAQFVEWLKADGNYTKASTSPLVIDVEAMRLTMLQAATLLDAESPADLEVAVAKYWASYGGSRVGHAGLHVHGGISIDLDYPIHRYFLWAKHLELRLGAGTAQLDRLGSMLAEAPVLDG